MSSEHPNFRTSEEARAVSNGNFVSMMLDSLRENGYGDFLSTEDLAAELGVSVRTLSRWNSRPDAPKPDRWGRRKLYQRSDAQHWIEQSNAKRGAQAARRAGTGSN